VVLIRPCVVVLPSSSLAPIGLGGLEGAIYFAVEGAIPFTGLSIQLNSEDAWLYA
jgi:hypothetical protein